MTRLSWIARSRFIFQLGLQLTNSIRSVQGQPAAVSQHHPACPTCRSAAFAPVGGGY